MRDICSGFALVNMLAVGRHVDGKRPGDRLYWSGKISPVLREVVSCSALVPARNMVWQSTTSKCHHIIIPEVLSTSMGLPSLGSCILSERPYALFESVTWWQEQSLLLLRAQSMRMSVRCKFETGRSRSKSNV